MGKMQCENTRNINSQKRTKDQWKYLNQRVSSDALWDAKIYYSISHNHMNMAIVVVCFKIDLSGR